MTSKNEETASLEEDSPESRGKAKKGARKGVSVVRKKLKGKLRAGSPASKAASFTGVLTAPSEKDYINSLEYSAKPADKLDIVAFELGGCLYGSEIRYVEEVLKPHEITPLPHLPEFVMGIISLRGEMIITLDLKMRLGLSTVRGAFARMLIVESKGFKVALTVDRMAGIRDVPACLEPVVSEGLGIEAGTLRYVKGLTSDDGLEIKILDMTKLLNPSSLAGTNKDG